MSESKKSHWWTSVHAAYDDYRTLFGSDFEAAEFEKAALRVSDDKLPLSVLAVRDGGPHTGEYWEWLTEQV